MDEKVSGVNGGDLGTRETDPGSVVVGRETLLPDSVPEAPGAEGDGPRGPGDPRDGAETRAESLRTSGTALRVTDSAPGSPGAPGAGLETLPRDLWRDLLRVVRDGAIYLAVAFAAYKLRMADKLDPATGVFMLLIAGVRAQNIAEFLTRGRGGGGAGGLAGVAILGIPAETFRSFFRS